MKTKQMKGIQKYIGLRFQEPNPEILYIFKFKKPRKISIDTFFCKKPLLINLYIKESKSPHKTITMKTNHLYVSDFEVDFFTEELATTK